MPDCTAEETLLAEATAAKVQSIAALDAQALVVDAAAATLQTESAELITKAQEVSTATQLEQLRQIQLAICQAGGGMAATEEKAAESRDDRVITQMQTATDKYGKETRHYLSHCAAAIEILKDGGK